ncbi:sugar transferase [Compostimonas suwonensis]|uniref:Undecaprenyl-phosphate galactose phosphotransferase WbaP/exopolysaccharide biosynthesis polyprenyl glycosylphosphotransferase n=1 Tax=Compostimonas suwonensis TaxID=1048394 RepID=A0A2M9BV17_9MICO|nr:sugar transferase [Compostimonas suwonensis]PJJ61801.1 Undecaprenyl-phosphate galactose phosphotransferase WbaP/exopolysaccharide biosynthesis polyprenyl glycosylphosphotransferase [Compostimonas suwonensis]
MVARGSRPTASIRRRSWQRSFAARLFTTDILLISGSVLGSQLLWFGFDTVELSADIPALRAGYTTVSIVLIVSWMLMLDLFGTRDHKVIGSGSLEYKRVTDATIRLFGVFAILAFLFRIELARGYFLTALPAGLLLLLFSRWQWRQWLRRRQAKATFVSRALLVGERDKSVHVGQTIQATPGAGLLLVGALTPDGRVTDPDIQGAPILGDFATLLQAVESSRADTVILTGSDELSPADMRRVGWELESRGVELIVAPALTDVAGPRIHARPVAGLPLIHVSYPTFEGVKRFSKRIFDILGSGLLIVVSSPLLLGIAIAVRRSGPGSILYRQERIGRKGTPFGMLKFRSMVQDADDQLESLLDAQGTSDTPLFKVTNDPRITPIGQVLRRHSLDELPQLFNVFVGNMSLVGPRPQRAAEVALYDDAAHRRLIMKPGMSGLWQVSGRSNLSWDDSIRLGLYYVENWSLTADVIILWRTVRAVVKPEGAV